MNVEIPIELLCAACSRPVRPRQQTFATTGHDGAGQTRQNSQPKLTARITRSLRGKATEMSCEDVEPELPVRSLSIFGKKSRMGVLRSLATVPGLRDGRMVEVPTIVWDGAGGLRPASFAVTADAAYILSAGASAPRSRARPAIYLPCGRAHPQRVTRERSPYLCHCVRARREALAGNAQPNARRHFTKCCQPIGKQQVLPLDDLETSLAVDQ
jgi:hypothetical protein